jgi:serine/threonine-protein kinase
LLESNQGHPEVVRRFIEEAQIGGQLQHPGIVPVYELGAFADRRPYFAMKLVKGQTLSSLLAKRTATPSLLPLGEGARRADEGLARAGEPAPSPRPSPGGRGGRTSDLPRFLAIFEQVCQTVAYAHARGVIHRDLKPSNVMVGAFGEVQVMDWGLAKVLPRDGADDEPTPPDVPEAAVTTVRSGSGTDASHLGSILGTPSYMAPEQARGELDLVDERADVLVLARSCARSSRASRRSSAAIGRRSTSAPREVILGRQSNDSRPVGQMPNWSHSAAPALPPSLRVGPTTRARLLHG